MKTTHGEELCDIRDEQEGVGVGCAHKSKRDERTSNEGRWCSFTISECDADTEFCMMWRQTGIGAATQRPIVTECGAASHGAAGRGKYRLQRGTSVRWAMRKGMCGAAASGGNPDHCRGRRTLPAGECAYLFVGAQRYAEEGVMREG
jgi:hypothetical protein